MPTEISKNCIDKDFQYFLNFADWLLNFLLLKISQKCRFGILLGSSFFLHYSSGLEQMNTLFDLYYVCSRPSRAVEKLEENEFGPPVIYYFHQRHGYIIFQENHSPRAVKNVSFFSEVQCPLVPSSVRIHFPLLSPSCVRTWLSCNRNVIR